MDIVSFVLKGISKNSKKQILTQISQSESTEFHREKIEFLEFPLNNFTASAKGGEVFF